MRIGSGAAIVAALLVTTGAVAAASPLEDGPAAEINGGPVAGVPATPAEGESTPVGNASAVGLERATADGRANASDGTLKIHTIDVGQADAILIVGPTGETTLIDSGDWRDDGETVLAALEARGIDRIDHLVATHGHADHVGGHEAVIDHFEERGEGIGAAYDSGVVHTSQTYERYLDAIERHDVPLYEVRAGDELPVPNVTVEVLNPPAGGADEEGDLHENSVALRLTYGETTFLLTGDAEADVERRLVETRGDDLAADVYWAGHHGSDTSSSALFLEAVDPEAAVVSSAYHSQYGHPHEETLERFAERSVATFWTATHGTITLESDGEVITVRMQAAATTDPAALRTADPAGAPPDELPAVGNEVASLEPNCGTPAAVGGNRGLVPAG